MASDFKKLFNFAIVTVAFFSCTNYDLDCFDNEQEKIKQEEIYSEVRAAFRDTLNSWINKGISPKTNFENSIYTIDQALICDSRRSKCIFFILKKDTGSSGKMLFSTKFIGSEINEDGSWNFYYRPYPTTYYSYLTEADAPFNYMSKETYMSLIQDGLMNDCSVNDDYLTGRTWFSDDRKEEHKKFLKDFP